MEQFELESFCTYFDVFVLLIKRIMDHFGEKIEHVKSDIRKMLEDPEQLPWYMSVRQLNMTIDELNKMNQLRDKNRFVPYYPKGLADSWAKEDRLGEELLEILDAYMKF